jgi:putative hydrolase of the HAD superfamily
MEIKHIFFDLDHTLWDFEKNSRLAFSFIFEKYEIKINKLMFDEVYQPINEKYWKLYREEKVSKEDLRFQRLKESFDLMSFQVSDETIHLLAHEYIENLANYNHVFENAYTILDYLQDKYTMHVITNGFDEVQHRKIQNANLLPYFKNVFTSERVGFKKPSPEIFNFAMEKARAKPEQSMMIGDNLEADIMGARAVGMQAIHCRFNGESETRENISIENLIELKRFL